MRLFSGPARPAGPGPVCVHTTVVRLDRRDTVTAPREILPGRTYLVTRRCTQRQFLLKPSPLTNALVRYCLAEAARHTGVLIHAMCFMSNHWHGVVTDPDARLPQFLERFHRLFARAQNAALGRWEALWSSDKPSVVALVSDSDVLEKIAYVIANPTAAGLVRRPSEWPGVISADFGSSTSVERPDHFFDPGGAMPLHSTLTITRPPIYAHLSDEALRSRILDAIEHRVRDAHSTLRRIGRAFLGLSAIQNQSFDAVPHSPEPRRNPNPRIAAQHTPERLRAINQLLDFVRRYRGAWRAWRAGKRDTIFPAGTYALRVYAQVACAQACSAA
jgi:putative transposase